MKSSPFFRQFSKPPPTSSQQPAGGDSNPLSPSSRSLSLPSSQPGAEEETPIPSLHMKPAHQPPPRSATYNAGFNSFSTTNQPVNLPISYTPINNNNSNNSNSNNNNNPAPSHNNNTYIPNNNNINNIEPTINDDDSIHSPPESPSKIKYKEKVRNAAANNLATKIVQKSTQRLRTPSSATVDSVAIAHAQQMVGDAATNTAHIVISKRDPALSTPPPPPTIISVPSAPSMVSKHFNNATTTIKTTPKTPKPQPNNAAPRRSPRIEKKV
jgi:hypothetical protein